MKSVLEGKALEDFNNWYMDENYIKSTTKKGSDERFRMSINMFNYLLLPHQQCDTILDFFAEKYNHYTQIILDQTSEPKFCFEVTKYNGFADFEKVNVPVDEWFLYRTKPEAKLAAVAFLNKLYNDQ